LTSNTRDESGAVYNASVTVADYTADLVKEYGDEWGAKFLELYPAANDSQASASLNAHYFDISKVSSWLWAELWHQAMTSNVHTCFWTHAPPGQDQGAYHESEINYVPNNLYDTDLPWESVDYTIATKMNAYWVNFAKDGDPNTGDAYPASLENLTYFPASTTANNMTFEVGNAFAEIPVVSPEQIELHKAYFASQVPF